MAEVLPLMQPLTIQARTVHGCSLYMCNKSRFCFFTPSLPRRFATCAPDTAEHEHKMTPSLRTLINTKTAACTTEHRSSHPTPPRPDMSTTHAATPGCRGLGVTILAQRGVPKLPGSPPSHTGAEAWEGVGRKARTTHQSFVIKKKKITHVSEAHELESSLVRE